MRELRIPKAIEIRFHFDGEVPKSSASCKDFSEELSVIERNGSEIISAVVMLEDRMIEAVSKLLFGTDIQNKPQRDFFTDEVISTSDFSFAFKRRVFTRLLESMQVLDQERINALRAGLNWIMEWRNAFAHGQVIHEHKAGFLLQYYSGGRKEIVIDDSFFDKVESTIRNCLYECNGIIQAQ